MNARARAATRAGGSTARGIGRPWTPIGVAIALLAALVPSGCTDEGTGPRPAESARGDHLPGALVILVTNNANSGGGSLREALSVAPSGSVVRFADHMAGETVALATPIGPEIAGKALTIEGPASDPVTISGGGSSALFHVGLSAELTIRHLVLADALGSLGGAIQNEGELTLLGSVIANSRAVAGGGIFSRGSRLTVRNSTIAGNQADAGGGIFVEHGIARITNSTLSGNEAELGAAIVHAPSGGGSVVTLENVTAVANATETGGAILGMFFAENLLVAENEGFDCGETTFLTLGFNLDSDGSCQFIPALSGLDALVGPLADNGGATPTHALLPGSPAINAGICGVTEEDQRGIARPQDGPCDIGAVEFTSVSLAIHPSGIVSPSTGAASVRGTLTCSGPLAVLVRLDLSQQQKARRVTTTVQGSGEAIVPCTDGADWEVTVQPTSGAFRNGKASAAAVATNSDDPSAVQSAVDLRWTK